MVMTWQSDTSICDAGQSVSRVPLLAATSPGGVDRATPHKEANKCLDSLRCRSAAPHKFGNCLRLKRGSGARFVGSTSANELSSRSDCLLRVTVCGENLVNGDKTRSHLWLVDLAGSERGGKIELQGERLTESNFINKSLSALGDVISAVASKASHTPYKNSKLTHILWSSIGGDCKTLMFVQISPSSSDMGETICSLNFQVVRVLLRMALLANKLMSSS